MDNLEKIYVEVAQEMGLSKETIKSIAESQFLFVANEMRKKDLNSVRLQFWGSFRIKPKRLDYLSDEAKEQIKNKLNGIT